MANFTKKPRAIDLYSGIGGWSLGLEMAGIEVVASYEWWDKANTTNRNNNHHLATEIDIRTLELADLPKDIDIVVGSPPCTQFSFANRGGSGDIEDGLKDIAKFLEVVDFLKPKFWAMENVPRVAGILENELRPGGRLDAFAHLRPEIHIIDTSNWGVPQRRQRCIAGNFDFSLLSEYRRSIRRTTLGDVVRSLAMAEVVDPNYGIKVPSGELRDHLIEEFLSQEEERMNREMKTYHPVYNNMAFPDPLGTTARTITATCTRVSRESIVIAAPEMPGRFRRLTVRERGCLQGFPITYQFYGNTYAQKIKMIGNAVPPLFTFYIAQAMLEVGPGRLKTPQQGIAAFRPTTAPPPQTRPDSVGNKYPATRRFRAAIPHLRFKSGVRFELGNSFFSDSPVWSVSFFFGNSKSIQELRLNSQLLDRLQKSEFVRTAVSQSANAFAHLRSTVASTDAKALQQVWCHIRDQGVHPYDLVDIIGLTAASLIDNFAADEETAALVVGEILKSHGSPIGSDKVLKHSVAMLSGFLVGAASNSLLSSSEFNA